MEKVRIAEAIVNLRAIAQAHQVYYMANASYLGATDMDKLEVEIPGTLNNEYSTGRIVTKYFIYSPTRGDGHQYLALAQRGVNGTFSHTYLFISPEDYTQVHCGIYDTASSLETDLCT